MDGKPDALGDAATGGADGDGTSAAGGRFALPFDGGDVNSNSFSMRWKKTV